MSPEPKPLRAPNDTNEYAQLVGYKVENENLPPWKRNKFWMKHCETLLCNLPLFITLAHT
jgi:hypothetical protein